tara:strand:+ start:451 stop:786 length:336 start_codon:yes stop_codon:yes gene_type:complete
MGINSTEVAYGFGQLGSAHTQTAANTITPPSGKVIVAITFLDNLALSALTPVQVNGADTYFGYTATANTSGNSEIIDTSVTFPKGLTIYGRWSDVSLNANSDHGILIYFGE